MNESLNDNAYPLVEDLIKNEKKYNISVDKRLDDVTVIDAGINAAGSYAAARIISEILMANFGNVSFFKEKIKSRMNRGG